MSNLHEQRLEAIKALEKRGLEHYQAHDDLQAAECFEKAAHLWELHAQKALSRTIEKARKRNAMASASPRWCVFSG